jgi:hypothetical protein
VVKNKVVQAVLASGDVDIGAHLVYVDLVGLWLLLTEVGIKRVHVYVGPFHHLAFLNVAFVAFYYKPFDLLGQHRQTLIFRARRVYLRNILRRN